MKVCARCGRENPEENVNCLRCGSRLDVVVQPDPEVGKEPEHVCYRHKNEKTDLACGRCGRFLCHRCVVLGPAGPRCHDCAKQDISLRPAAIVHEAKVGTSRLFGSAVRGPWSWILIFMVISLLSSVLRSQCNPSKPDHYVPIEAPKQQGKDAEDN